MAAIELGEKCLEGTCTEGQGPMEADLGALPRIDEIDEVAMA